MVGAKVGAVLLCGLYFRDLLAATKLLTLLSGLTTFGDRCVWNFMVLLTFTQVKTSLYML